MKENVSVANNACWAIGEVAVKVCKHIDIFSTQQATNYCFLSQNGHLLISGAAGNIAYCSECHHLPGPNLVKYRGITVW